MNTKKLLSLVLSLVMVCSVMATLTVTASAMQIFVKDGEIKYTLDSEPSDTIEYIKAKLADKVFGDDTMGYRFELYFADKKLADDPTLADYNIQKESTLQVLVDGTYLDLEASTTDILDSKELDQNYNLTVEEGDKTDVTKVKLSWTISDINAVRADNKIWDTTELKWVDVAGTPTVTDNGTATFKLENYSSVKVDAAVTFDTAEYEEGKKFTAPTLTFDEITGTDGKITLDTANGNETYSKTNVPTGTIHVTVTPVADDFKSLNATATAKLYGVYTVTISECAEEQPGGDCLAKGTKITMANGTLKNIEDITEGDEVLTYNHEAGRYEAQRVYLAWASESPKCAFTLHFTNGIEIPVIGDHCFFEKESLSYVAVFDDTAEDFIGKHFYNAAAGRYEELLFVTYDKTPVDYYEIYTEYNANCVAEGMLNVAYDSSEVLNIYKFNEDLTIDHEQLASDIAEYGIFEYVENDRYSKRIYDALGWKYGYVMIGKGFGTADEFRARMDAFLAD